MYTSDAGIRTAEQIAPLDLAPVFYKNPENYTETSLAFYLSRPLKIQSGTLQVTDTATTFTPIALPQNALTNPFYNEKPKGRFGFRATVVLRLVVNADRFQQGRYMLTWCPLGGANYSLIGGNKGNSWVNNHSATLTQRSNMPHVEFDLACDTEVVIKIPYASSYDFYQFSWANSNTTGQGTWGVARLYPYIPLNYGLGTSVADYSIFVHFEDVEFIGFDSTAIVAQSSSPFETIKRKKNPSMQEAQSENVGPITGITRKIAHSAKLLSPLPMLGPFMGSLSWVSDIMSDAAGVFGWSSPSNIEKVARMQRTNFPYLVNVNKVDNTLPLGFNTDNYVDVAPGFAGTNIDELDITYLCSIPTWITSRTWSTSDTGSITSLSVYPFWVSSGITYQTLTNYSVGPMSYLARKFPFWRGSITFKFKLVKTEFHSGRLAISYIPSGTIPTTLTELDYYHRDIIDIREHNEFSITVPWSQPEQYLPTSSMNGRLNISIYDRLQCPSSVAQSISIIVEVCGGPDIEFFGSHYSAILNFNNDFVIQSADPFSTKSDCVLLAKTVGTATTPTFQVDTSRLCVGERIMSLRQLIKSVRGIDHSTPSPGKIIRFWPYLNPTMNTDGTTASINIQPDLIGELSNIYMFSRGSIRVRFAPLENTTSDWITTLAAPFYLTSTNTMLTTTGTSYATYTAGVPNTSNLLAGASNVITDITANGMIEVQCPMYARARSRNNAMSLVCNASSASNGSLNNLSFLEFSQMEDNAAKSTTSRFILARSGGDDMNFGMFISIPPIVTTAPLI